MNLVHKLINNPLLRSSFFSIIARFTGVALNFAASILITRQLEMSEAGVVFMLMLFVTGVSLLSRVGVDQFIVKSVASIHDDFAHQRSAILINSYKLLSITSLIFMFIWVVASPWIKDAFFDNDIATNDLRIAGIAILFFNLVTTNSFYLKGLKRSASSVLVQNAVPALSFLFLIAIFWTGFKDNHFAVNLYTFSIVIAGVVSTLVIIPHTLLKSPPEDTPSPYKIFKDSIPLAPVSFFSFFMLWADTLMVGWYLPNEEVALYNVAAKISFISLFFLGALDATIYPRLLATFKHKKDILHPFFWQSTLLVIATLLVVTLGMLLFSELLLLAFNDQYVSAKIALVLLLFAQFFRATSLTFSFMFIIREKVRYLNIILTVALILNLVCNMLFIPIYGIEGAAIATFVANIFLSLSVISLFLLHKLLPRTEVI